MITTPTSAPEFRGTQRPNATSSLAAKHIGQTIVLGLCVLLFILIATDTMQRFLGMISVLGPLKLLLLSPMLLFVAQYHRHFFRGAFCGPEMSLLMLLAIASATWSLDTLNTVERLLPLIVTTAFSMTLGSLLSLRGAVLFLGAVSLAIALTNFAAIATIADARGIPPWENTWRGVHNHKNGLGGSAMICCILALSAAVAATGRLRLVFSVGFLLQVTLLIASESRSSQMIAALALIALVIAFSYRRHLAFWASMVIFVAVSIVLVSYVLLATGVADPVFEALDRKTTLSGRLPLWQLVWPQVLEKFWLGYGYLSFWDPEARRVVEIARDPTLRFTPFYSHNGLIETLLNVGFLGLLLFIAAIIRLFSNVFLLLRTMPGNILIVPMIVYSVAFLLHNVTESSILARDGLLWMVLVIMMTKMSTTGRALREEAAAQRRDRRANLVPANALSHSQVG